MRPTIAQEWQTSVPLIAIVTVWLRQPAFILSSRDAVAGPAAIPVFYPTGDG